MLVAVFILVALGGCYYSNGVQGQISKYGDSASTGISTERSESVVPTSHQIRTTGKYKQETTSSLVRIPTQDGGPNIVVEVTTRTGSNVITTTGRQESEAGESPTASVLAIGISVCLLFLLFGGILLTLCLVIRSRRLKGGDPEDAENGLPSNRKDSGWRERLASHIQPKRKDTRSNADDIHPYVLYNVKHGKANSFVHSSSFSGQPSSPESSRSPDEAGDFKDGDPILPDSNNGYVQKWKERESVHGIENIGYTPESPVIHPKLSEPNTGNATASAKATPLDRHVPYVRNDRSILEMDSAGQSSFVDSIGKETNADENSEHSTIGDVSSETLMTSEIDDGDNEGSDSDDDSGSESSTCGFWSPNPGSVAEDGEEGGNMADKDSSIGSEDGDVVDNDGEPPYSTWPVIKLSDQVPESESDVSLIEPIGSDEEEDPYDTLKPGTSLSHVSGSVKKVKRKLKCVSALKGQFSDSDEESPYDSLPSVPRDDIVIQQGGTSDGRTQRKGSRSKDQSKVSPYDMAKECEWPPSIESSECHLCETFVHPPGQCISIESPYDTLPLRPPRPVEIFDESSGEDVDEIQRRPTYATVPEEVLGPSFKERVETFLIEHVSSSSEDSLGDEDVQLNTRKMSLEISGFENEADKCQGHLEAGQSHSPVTDGSFVFVDGKMLSEMANSVSLDAEDMQSIA